MISINDLSDDQKNAIRQWAADGAGLDEIHTRMRDEFNLRLTFMDARFLVADLEIDFDEEEEEEEEAVAEVPADAAAAPTAESAEQPAAAAESAAEEAIPEHTIPAEEVEGLLNDGAADGDAPAAPNVTVEISDIAAPGAMASGTVNFGNGETAVWTVDQMGRLGLNPTNQEYEPTEAEVLAFQVELQRMIQSRGY